MELLGLVWASIFFVSRINVQNHIKWDWNLNLFSSMNESFEPVLSSTAVFGWTKWIVPQSEIWAGQLPNCLITQERTFAPNLFHWFIHGCWITRRKSKIDAVENVLASTRESLQESQLWLRGCCCGYFFLFFENVSQKLTCCSPPPSYSAEPSGVPFDKASKQKPSQRQEENRHDKE